VALNWVRFGLTATYGLIVFIFFFLYLAGFISTSNLSNDVLYVGFVIMIGIVLSMAASTSETKPSHTP
jgi:cytochrome b561